MRFAFTVHQKAAVDAGIPNGNCLLVLEIVALANTWATAETYDGAVYFFTARQMIAKELCLWNLKPDTVYRHLKILDDLGLIDYQKNGKKDLTRLTKKGRTFFGAPMSDLDPKAYVGSESEKEVNSDLDPSLSGSRSEKNSEIDPTDHNYKNNIRKTKGSGSSRSILPNVYKDVALRYLKQQQWRWSKVVEFSKPMTVCITLANLDLPTDPEDQMHGHIVKAIQAAVDDGEYTTRNRKPITSAIEAAVIRLQTTTEATVTANSCCTCGQPSHNLTQGQCHACFNRPHCASCYMQVELIDEQGNCRKCVGEAVGA